MTSSEATMFNEWYAIQTQIKELRAKESELRKRIVETQFDESKAEGTENKMYGNGWGLKVVKKLTRTVKATETELEAVLHQLPEVTAERIIKYKPSLDAKEYKALSEAERLLVDSILVIKEGAPTLSVIEPKEQ